jgi:hypothetical protein
VEWREHGAGLDLGDDLGRHQHRRRELLAAVHHPVSDRLDVAGRLQDAVFGVDQHAQRPVDRRAMLEDLAIVLVGRPARDRQRQPGVGKADLLDLTDRERQITVLLDPFQVGLDDLVLDGRRAAVKDEDLHGSRSGGGVV